jgi:hypothetical protein
MPQEANRGRTIAAVAAIVAAFWLGGCLGYFWGWFGKDLFALPFRDLTWLGAWLVVPVALIAACAGLIQALTAESPKGRSKNTRR